MAVPRVRPGRYPAVLSYGFRPFFLVGALYSGLALIATAGLALAPILHRLFQSFHLEDSSGDA